MNSGLRFTRQMRLPEIGEKGQERLSNATASPSTTGFSAEIEALYLERAGVTISSSRPPDPKPTPHPAPNSSPDLGLRDPACREVAAGALNALRTLRSVLEAS